MDDGFILEGVVEGLWCVVEDGIGVLNWWENVLRYVMVRGGSWLGGSFYEEEG